MSILEKLRDFIRAYAQSMWAIDFTIAGVLTAVVFLLDKYLQKKKELQISESEGGEWL